MNKKKTSSYRIEVVSRVPDSRSTVKQKQLHTIGFNGQIKQLWLSDIYTIEKELNQNALSKVIAMLSNPITQQGNVSGKIQHKKFDFVIEIGFHPGVTDNIASTAKESIGDLLKSNFTDKENVYTSNLYFIEGKLNANEVRKIAEYFSNPLINQIAIYTHNEFVNKHEFKLPSVTLPEKQNVGNINLNIRDEKLAEIGKKGIKNQDGSYRGPLALDLEAMKAIKNYFEKIRRTPTDVEIESIAQTWSEHCKHSIFANPIDEYENGLYKTFIQKATKEIRSKKGKKDICVSVFIDNSGGIIFDDNYVITHKVETHNSPSALDPFGGAITGIVGVNRDALGFGLGAKPVANTYGFCFADPNDNDPLYKDESMKQKMLSPRRIMDGVISGVNVGGNCSGIPTPQGFMYFDKSYKGKPLVFVGTVGLIPRKINGKDATHKKANAGDYIVMIGGRVGKDGIHGATFSSDAINSGSPVTAVQIGDPITQKKLSDAIIREARDLELYSSITDNGAGGLSCSVCEMAQESNGCRVELEKVPLKYPGLAPWEIWISESQERMTLSVPKKNWILFKNLMDKRGVEATIIGTFTNSSKCIVTYNKKLVMDIDIDFLHNGLPKKHNWTRKVEASLTECVIPLPKNYTSQFHEMLARNNIAGYSFVSSQFDHEVQSSSVLKPLQGKGRINADATVIKPVLSSNKGVAFSQGLYPSYSEISPYDMAACSLDTAIRNIVSVGANIESIALLDNFCWCSSEDPKRLWQLKQSAQACYDFATYYETPFISGKDSMFNDFKGFNSKGESIHISILPTLLISSIGVIENCEKVVSLDFKMPGDHIYVLGNTYEEFGGTEYMLSILEKNNFGNMRTPKVNPTENKHIYKVIFQCIQSDLISSSQSIGRGGLACALAKSAMGGMLGISVDLAKLPGVFSRNDAALFSESQGRILVSVSESHIKRFKRLIKNTPHALIGIVRNDSLIRIKGIEEKLIISSNVQNISRYYNSTFSEY